MNVRRSHIVIVGGINESERMFDSVAEEAIGLEMSDDVVVFTLQNALDKQESKFKAAARSARRILTHGAGALAIPASERIDAVTMVAPNEPYTATIQKTTKRIVSHITRETVHPRLDHARLAARSLLYLTAHAHSSSHLSSFAANTSMYEIVKSGHIQCDSIGYFPMSDDQYYGQPDKDKLLNLEWWENITGIVNGGHDELLLEPGIVLSSVQSMTETGMNIAWARQGVKY